MTAEGKRFSHNRCSDERNRQQRNRQENYRVAIAKDKMAQFDSEQIEYLQVLNILEIVAKTASNSIFK